MATSPLITLLVPALGMPQDVVDLPVADELLCTEFSEELRIADDLTTVSSIGFDANGVVRIGDTNGIFRVIAATSGGEQFEFGRRGEGPGEYASAADMVALAYGHTLVRDLDRDVFIEYLPNGQFRRRVDLGELSDALNMIYRADRNGGLLGQLRVEPRDSERDPETLATSWTDVEGPREVMRVDLEGGTVRTSTLAVGWTPPQRAFIAEQTMRFRDGRYEMEGTIFRVAFLPRLLWDALPDGGLAMSDSSAYAIKILDDSGRVVRILRRSLPNRPINAAFRQSYRARELDSLAAKMADLRSGPEEEVALLADMLQDEEDMERNAIENMEFANEVPLVDDLITTWNGMIWVRRTSGSILPLDLSANPSGDNLHRDLQTNQANRPTAPVDILTPEGAYLGTMPEMRWPAALGPDNRIAYIEADEFSVPIVLVGRLTAVACRSGSVGNL